MGYLRIIHENIIIDPFTVYETRKFRHTKKHVWNEVGALEKYQNDRLIRRLHYNEYYKTNRCVYAAYLQNIFIVLHNK